MSVFNYSRYKIVIDPQSKKTQGLQIGDVVRRQYFDSPNQIYSLMLVLETGKDIIQGAESSYFIGALLEGDEPKNGELLDFVRVTNLFNQDRSGALYLTASDSESPFMDVIDGLAVEKSLCYPFMGDGDPEKPGRNRYACNGGKFLTTSYTEHIQEHGRVFRLTRNSVASQGVTLGIKQSLEHCPEHPARLLISYKTRASQAMKGVKVSLGYTDGKQFDGTTQINVSTQWDYQLQMITVDYPVQYQRSFCVDLTEYLDQQEKWFEIADLNILQLSDVAVFSEGTKVRIGKVQGVIDPVFGVLDGFGAYFQNMYATKNVNIAGTLTAGDEGGFSSNFYVGKIHKNAFQNSVDCAFNNDMSMVMERSPAGTGRVWRLQNSVSMVAQTAGWRTEHIGERYCFSFWAQSPKEINLTLSQDEHVLGTVKLDSVEWKRYSFPFVVLASDLPELCIRMTGGNSTAKFSAPQLEAGVRPTPYQPTDEKLSYTDEYGAWFARGGIGGTIQNPLLKLNDDGSISSRDGSFVIRPDGTGYFASGKFAWSKSDITLKDVTIKWEDLDEEAQDKLLPVTADIESKSGLIIKNGQNDVDLKAVLYKDGKEIDATGSLYRYEWSLWDSTGNGIIKNYTGKAIVVSRSDIIDKNRLSYKITEK